MKFNKRRLMNLVTLRLHVVLIIQQDGRMFVSLAATRRVGHNTQFAGPRAADGLSAPHGETLLPFPPQPKNITERARGQEGCRGVGGWVRTSCRDTQINTSCIKHTRSGKASALGVLREEVLGIKVLCAPGPAVQGRSARAPSPAVP
jgi:hypothetical protein